MRLSGAKNKLFHCAIAVISQPHAVLALLHAVEVLLACAHVAVVPRHALRERLHLLRARLRSSALAVMLIRLRIRSRWRSLVRLGGRMPRPHHRIYGSVSKR